MERFFLLTLLLKGDLLGQSKKSLSVCASTTYGILHVFLIQYMFHPDTLWINGEGTLSPFRVRGAPFRLLRAMAIYYGG